MPSKIDWCDETVNPLGWGCYGPDGTPEEPKPCWYCYAERMAKGPYAPRCALCVQFIPHWHPEAIEKIYRWKKPRKIFWQSMGDLFHPHIPSWMIEVVLTAVMATPQHTHIFCTKNPARYYHYSRSLENCMLLTTVTNQADVDEKVPELFKVLTKKKGLSLEPLLGPVDLNRDFDRQMLVRCRGMNPAELKFSWLIIGAMSGRGAEKHQPDPAWVQGLIDQARAAGVPVFVKGEFFKQFPIQEWPE